MNYIRNYYGVPAKRGARIYYTHAKKYGTIVGSKGAYLRIRMDGEGGAGGLYHPTWCIQYL